MLPVQSELVASCIDNGDDAGAEVLASLGGDSPCELALLASVYARRSTRLAALDPARATDARSKAEALFDAVEESGDALALGIVAFLLNELADSDDAAMVRLNRIVATLTTEQARLFRDAVVWAQNENSKRSEGK